MNQEQIQKALALEHVRFGMHSEGKRFMQTVVHLAKTTPEKPLTVTQAAYLDGLIHRYRRQVNL